MITGNTRVQQYWIESKRQLSSFSHRRQRAEVASYTTDDSAIKSNKVSREEFKGLVDLYGASNPSLINHQQPSKSYARLAPRLMMTAEEEEEEEQQQRRRIYSTWMVPPIDADHETQLNRFKRRLSLQLGRTDLERLWQTYQRLPSPRLRYINTSDIRRFFRQLSWAPPHRGPLEGAYYFQLLQECLSEKIPITRAEWNTAIAFAGRRRGKVITYQEVQHAAEIWLQMEQAKTQADSVTFGILFDMAVKAGCFALADTIYHEVLYRDLELDRYFRTSLIYYAGVRADGDAVRQAFRDFIDAGELVDTVVMNCVIASLIRTGEPAAAEQVFARMKRLYAEKMGADAVDGWRIRRATGRQLRREAVRLRAEKQEHEKSFFGTMFSTTDQRETIQNGTPIAPDSKTYQLLIQHHALTAGDLGAVLNLLAEMKKAGLKVSGAAYVAIFRAFGKRGGIFHAEWNRTNLESIWKDFVADMVPITELVPLRQENSEFLQLKFYEIRDRGKERTPYFTIATVLQILRAFNTCAGHDRMETIWAEIQGSWKDMSDDNKEELQIFVDGIVQTPLDQI